MEDKFESLWNKVDDMCLWLLGKISPKEVNEWFNKRDALRDEKYAFLDALKKWQQQKCREASANGSRQSHFYQSTSASDNPAHGIQTSTQVKGSLARQNIVTVSNVTQLPGDSSDPAHPHRTIDKQSTPVQPLIEDKSSARDYPMGNPQVPSRRGSNVALCGLGGIATNWSAYEAEQVCSEPCQAEEQQIPQSGALEIVDQRINNNHCAPTQFQNLRREGNGETECLDVVADLENLEQTGMQSQARSFRCTFDVSTQTQEEVEIQEGHPLCQKLQLKLPNLQGPQATSTGKSSQRNDRLSASTWESENDSGFLESPLSPRCALSPYTVASECMRQVFGDEEILQSGSYCQDITHMSTADFHGGQQTTPRNSPEIPAFVTERPVTESGSPQAEFCSFLRQGQKCGQPLWLRVRAKLSSHKASFSTKCPKLVTTLYQQLGRLHHVSSNFKWKTRRKLAALHGLQNCQLETNQLEMQFMPIERSTTKLLEYHTLLTGLGKVTTYKDQDSSLDPVTAGGDDPVSKNLKPGSKPTLTTQNRGQQGVPGSSHRPRTMSTSLCGQSTNRKIASSQTKTSRLHSEDARWNPAECLQLQYKIMGNHPKDVGQR